MADIEKMTSQGGRNAPGRKGFLYTLIGGVIAALAGCISGAPAREQDTTPQPEPTHQQEPTPAASEARLSALEARVAQLAQELAAASNFQPLGELEGEMNERVVFNKSELTVANPEGVLLNLVATQGHVGIRFYKDFGFGNEQVTGPWHMGFIEGVDGYQGLAILRDWQFTAALWDEDGKLTLGRLHPHPPANEPARARVHIKGTRDEVQAIVEASKDQATDIFQVIGGEGAAHLAVDRAGNLVVGSPGDPRAVVLHDTQDGSAYLLTVTGGQLALARA
jgi:hypothetical protein